jgi:hypothetical protein
VEDWGEFALLSGGVLGALVGLLFVAVSIRADALDDSVRARVGQILAIFLGLLTAVLCLSLPNPTISILGGELVVTAILLAIPLGILNRRARRERRDRRELVLDRVNPSVTTAVLLRVCGLGLLAGVEAALFLLPVAVTVGIVGGAVGAWLVLVRPRG